MSRSRSLGGRRSIRIDLHDHGAPAVRRELDFARDLRRHVPQHQAEALARPAVPAAGARSGAALAALLFGLEIQFVDCQAHRAFAPSAFWSPSLRMTFTGTDVPGLVAVTILISSFVLRTGRPLNSTITSPGSDAALVGCAARLDHVRRPRPSATSGRSPGSRRCGTASILHADPAARHLAGVQLRQQLADGVDRHGEADADVAAAAACRSRCSSR